MLGFPLDYLRGMRIIMFQLFSFYLIRALFKGFLYGIPSRVPATLLQGVSGSPERVAG